MDVHNISTIELSKYINVIRNFLIKTKFFEHHLYSTTNYKIENTNSFNISPNLFLRYNPEPDIWTAGKDYNKFFWVGSMFRDEKEETNIHKKEFTVIDIYLRDKNMNDVVNFFISLLEKVEIELKLPKLSKLPVKYLPYGFFNVSKFNKEDKFWAIVTGYPKNESFYDEKEGDVTKKFEIFLVNGEEKTEISACGALGDNLNENMFVKDKSRSVDNSISSKKFIGFGFGIERLVYIYNNL